MAAQQTPAAAALINAVPVGAGAAVAAKAGTAVAANAIPRYSNAHPTGISQLQTQEFMAANGNILEVDNIIGLLAPLTDIAIKMAIPDDMDLSNIGLVRQFFEQIVQITRNSEELPNDYTKRCLGRDERRVHCRCC